MKIDDLIQLLNNRLREFKLSRDYARMSGDLGRMNAADKEVLALEDTLFKLNLLVDTSKSAAVKEEILSEVITDGSVAVLGEYDITPYATDPLHEEKIMNILSKMGVMDTVEKIDDYISGKYLSSPVTGEMVMSASLAYAVDARLMMAIMEQDSSFGTLGIAVSTLNPGNVGNDDDGNIRTYDSWQEGVTAVAEWLSRHRVSTIIPEETVLEPTATSTPSFIAPTATSTPIITTSTTTTITNIPTTSTTTPATADSTGSPQATSTPATATTTPVTPNQDSSGSSGTGQAATSTSATTTSTTTTATTTPVTATSTDSTVSTQPTPEATAGTASSFDSAQDESPQTSPWQATTTEETVSTSSPQAATSTAN